MESGVLYLFLDEGGNFDFSESGTKYFVLSCVTAERPFPTDVALSELKYDLIEAEKGVEYFHASEDSLSIREGVFKIIAQHLSQFKVDSLIVEKRKTGPSLQAVERFYPRMMHYLLQHVLAKRQVAAYRRLVIMTDSIPIKKKRRSVEKAIKSTLHSLLPDGIRYSIMHHASKSNFGLQLADYCNWAVYREWDRGDRKYYDVIAPAIESEFDIFQTGTTFYY